MANIVAMTHHVLDDELQLVDELRVEHQVLRPHITLVLREEVPKAEVLGDLSVLILPRDLDEAIEARVRLRSNPAALEWPIAHPVAADAAFHLVGEGTQRDEREER